MANREYTNGPANVKRGWPKRFDYLKAADCGHPFASGSEYCCAEPGCWNHVETACKPESKAVDSEHTD